MRSHRCLLCHEFVLYPEAASYLECDHVFHRVCLVNHCWQTSGPEARVFCSLCHRKNGSEPRETVSPYVELQVLVSELAATLGYARNVRVLALPTITRLIDECKVLLRREQIALSQPASRREALAYPPINVDCLHSKLNEIEQRLGAASGCAAQYGALMHCLLPYE